MCLGRRIKQTLGETTGIEKRMGQERLSPLSGHYLNARRKRAEDGTERGEEQKSRMSETGVELCGDSENGVFLLGE